MQLSPVQARVLGALMEKETTTPEYYPLTLNALLAACNQKSSRDPVMALSERDVELALREMEPMGLVSVNHGTRVERYENRARTVFQLRRDETAILCLLLLRGPQTPGELRSRAERLFVFDDIPAVQSALARMSAPAENRADPLVVALPRQAGTKEQRHAHTLLDPLLAPAVPPAPEPSRTWLQEDARDERTSTLEARVEALEAEVARLAGLLDRSGMVEEKLR